MRRPSNDDPARAFQREMQRAERERRALVLASCVAVAAILVIVGTLVAVASAGDSDPTVSGASKDVASLELAIEEQAAEGAGNEAPAEEPAGDDVEAEEPEEPSVAPAPKIAPAPKPKPKPAAPAVQRLVVGLGQFGYDPSTLTAKAGTPIQLTVAQGEGCAAGFLIPQLGIAADNTTGPAIVKLPALKPGRYRFTCGMEMVEGRLVVQ